MKHKTLSAMVAGALLMGATAWATFPSASKQSGDASKFHFMHCPECEREQTYTQAAFEAPCLYCEKRLVGTEMSIKPPGNTPNRYGRMFIFLYVEVLVIMAVVWFVSRDRDRPKEEDYLYMNCENCRQKIRYTEKKIGHVAICRRCKHCFHYPEEAIDAR